MHKNNALPTLKMFETLITYIFYLFFFHFLFRLIDCFHNPINKKTIVRHIFATRSYWWHVRFVWLISLAKIKSWIKIDQLSMKWSLKQTLEQSFCIGVTHSGCGRAVQLPFPILVLMSMKWTLLYRWCIRGVLLRTYRPLWESYRYGWLLLGPNKLGAGVEAWVSQLLNCWGLQCYPRWWGDSLLVGQHSA